MSYARFNDDHDDGQLTAFRTRLSAEVRAQTGREFLIFQDRADIAWGQNWQQRIEETLDVVTLLVAVITPGFFGSTACREEVALFLERERKLGRDDLILPVYYIGAREMDDAELRGSDELAHVLATRQFADWRELRFEPFTNPLVRRAIAQLASRMRDTFWQPGAVLVRPAAARGRQANGAAGAAEQAGTDGGRQTAKTEPPTHVVDAWGRGDFTTVTEAVKAAKAGDRILVRPGLYEEALVVDKPLEIVGDGPVADIEVRARGASALLFRANIGRVANLTLRQAGGDGSWAAVDITQGRLDLEGCDITSQTLSCILIHNGADPRLRRNHIHDGKECGVYLYEDGLGTLEDNDITANTLSGVQIKTGSNPTLRRNRIRDGKVGGVMIYDNGLGTLEDNDITANTYAGVQIKTGGNPIVRRNQIHHGKESGVYVYEEGLGTLEDNEITGNSHAGVVIRSGGNPALRRNRVNGNGYQAVWICDGGKGVLEDNDLTGNTRGAWEITDDCEANVTRARNKEQET
ncbi:MAG TPA: right-handed parallel beta-helix repeat-containing protein [Streptosporangiaceae bacterium]|jgi:F-box protein 11